MFKVALAASITTLIFAFCLHSQSVQAQTFHSQTQELNTGGCVASCAGNSTATPVSAFGEYRVDIHQLMQTLGGAYANSLRHLVGADLATQDFDLEKAAIQLSSTLLDGLDQNKCQSAEAKDFGPDSACPSIDNLAKLPELVSSLSYAAYQLEKLQTFFPATADGQSTEISLTETRLAAMEHLYRMSLTVANMFFDPSQSGTYVQPAEEELQLARSDLQEEETLCNCGPEGYTILLAQLSQLGGRINTLARTSMLENREGK